MLKTAKKALRIIAAELLSNRPSLWVIGRLLRLVYKGRIKTLAIFYPANKDYLEKVTFSWYVGRAKWRLSIGGFFLCQEAGGVIFFMGGYEDDFMHPDNSENLLKIHHRAGRLASLMGLEVVSYSGLLPTHLIKIGVAREPIEHIRTAHWIIKGIGEVKKQAHLPDDTPMVILGAAGAVGRRVVDLLRSASSGAVFEVDPVHPDPDCRDFPQDVTLQQTRVMIVNISRRNALDQYIGLLRSDTVILNEVYPECPQAVLNQLREKDIRYFHLKGVAGWSFPQFPGAYAGAIPCCAASAAEFAGRNNRQGHTVIVEERR